MTLWIVAAYLLAHAIFFGVGRLADAKGIDRTPERGISYSVATLQALAHRERRYVVPFLFPIDLIVMLALSGSLYAAARYWGSEGLHLWPALVYLLFDLAEDSVLALMLAGRVPISARTVPALKLFTTVKFAAIGLAEVVAVAALAVAAYRCLAG
jgi:hypothetical protein